MSSNGQKTVVCSPSSAGIAFRGQEGNCAKLGKRRAAGKVYVEAKRGSRKGRDSPSEGKERCRKYDENCSGS